MSDLAFDEAYRLRARNTDLAAAGVEGYPRRDEIQKALVLEDISLFLEAVRSLDAGTKEAIRKQIAQNAEKAANAAHHGAEGEDGDVLEDSEGRGRNG